MKIVPQEEDQSLKTILLMFGKNKRMVSNRSIIFLKLTKPTFFFTNSSNFDITLPNCQEMLTRAKNSHLSCFVILMEFCTREAEMI